jgi:hypothetical protein
VDNHEKQLALLTCSQQMLVMAQQANWSQLALLEQTFGQQVKDYFQQPYPKGTTGLVAEHSENLAKQLLEQQSQVQALIKRAQKHIQTLMASEEHNIKAMHSYLATEKNK